MKVVFLFAIFLFTVFATESSEIVADEHPPKEISEGDIRMFGALLVTLAMGSLLFGSKTNDPPIVSPVPPPESYFPNSHEVGLPFEITLAKVVWIAIAIILTCLVFVEDHKVSKVRLLHPNCQGWTYGANFCSDCGKRLDG